MGCVSKSGKNRETSPNNRLLLSLLDQPTVEQGLLELEIVDSLST